MPSGLRYSGLGYMSYGQPAQVVSRGPVQYTQNQGSTSYGAPVITQPVSGAMPPLTLGWNRVTGIGAHPTQRVYGTRVPTGGGPRRILNAVLGILRPGVSAQSQSSNALGAPQQSASQPVPYYGTTGPNSNSPLFGNPGFAYTNTLPQWRLGPTPKLAPGTGLTNRTAGTRHRGFQPAGYASKQDMGETSGLVQYDYTPMTDPTFDLGHDALQRFAVLPRSINAAYDGVELVGTYRAHDNVQADHFFKQGRSSANWQDMSFGPSYRYLLPYQQAARYNLYNQVALARMLAPNNYFLGYQTQPATAAQLGGTGQGRPLGY